MNKHRRKELDDAGMHVQHARALIENARDEEQEYYDNMPENMQGGEKGDRAQEVVNNLQEALDALDEVDQALGSAGE